MGMARKMAQRLARPIHVALRSQKVDSLLALLGPDRGRTLLDLGGGLGIAGEFARLYERFENVIVLNLDAGIPNGCSNLPVLKIRADGCQLPFPSRSIDWVFSNAVIEHVGGWSKQQKFADEIRRVAAKGYFVTTPNRNFPVEPHTLLPFYQFLPVSLQRRVVPWSPGYMKEYEEINLLSGRDLQRLFPEAEVNRMGIPLCTNTLAAAYRTGW